MNGIQFFAHHLRVIVSQNPKQKRKAKREAVTYTKTRLKKNTATSHPKDKITIGKEMWYVRGKEIRVLREKGY